MAESTTPSVPRRALRRAAGLLNARGQPSDAAIGTIYEGESSQHPTTHPSPLKRAASLGVSIKQKLKQQGQSLTRTLSSSGRRPTSRHTRALSDSLPARPTPPRAHSTPSFIASFRRTSVDSKPLSANNSSSAHRVSSSESSSSPPSGASPPPPASGTASVDVPVPSTAAPSSSSSPPPPPLPSPPKKVRRKSMADVQVPSLLRQGTPMTKVSKKKQIKVIFRLDPDQGQILYDTKELHIIPIECIKEIRSGPDARYYREQFQLSSEYESRWLTIIHLIDGEYKTLHAIAPTPDVFRMWDVTLRRLHDVRRALMSGLGNGEMREEVWARQYWSGADEERDDKLDFDDVERMCRRLNINSPREELMRLFKEADTTNAGSLEFAAFQRFVKLLKRRPEIDRLYKRLKATGTALKFDFGVFVQFMRDYQKSNLDDTALEVVFRKYASPLTTVPPSPLPSPDLTRGAAPLGADVPAPPTIAITAPSQSSSVGATPPASATPPVAGVTEAPPTPSAATSTTDLASTLPLDALVLAKDGFTSFLLSSDNAAFADGPAHDMSHPLWDYYISSSHNTYLVGHQLMGESTIEGYIRALLHGCRSVELDIYDGDIEPVVYHGKTLTSRVPVRDICKAIAKYAFVASPYPIILSAEIHCNVAQQDLLAKIMHDVFGDALVSAPLDGRPKIEVLPSPEDLRGRVMLKCKNLYVSTSEGLHEKEISVDTESSTSTTDSSASDFEPVKELKQDLNKARRIINRVRRRSSSRHQQHAGTPPRPPSALAQRGNTDDGSASGAKVKMSFQLVALLVYTVGVKCRGINKKETYAPEHMFSLSEKTANKIIKDSMIDLIKHNRAHLVRIYPKGLRVSSSNYEPHRYWSAGAQLVALNWQTFDLGYMINHAMFQRNNRHGYVLKPRALREPSKDLLNNRTKHFLDVTIISAQQLPRRKDKQGREVIDKSIMDPLVEVSIHIPDWTHSPFLPTSAKAQGAEYSAPTGSAGQSATTARTVSFRTTPVKNNGFNPVWEEKFSLPFDCVGDMKELVFVRFAVKDDDDGDDDEPMALYCASLGNLQQGYRHLPMHDAQMSQYLFSTLFVYINIRDA